MIASLPTNGQGFSVFKGGVPGAPGVLSSNEQFYSWLNDNLIGVIYKDAQCGNGICESPEEVKGVGEYGWYEQSVDMCCVAVACLLKFKLPRLKQNKVAVTMWLSYGASNNL